MRLLVLLASLATKSEIVDVEIRGTRLVPDATVQYHLGPLEELSPPEAFRRLWETGLFEDLRFETETVEGGRRLVVVATEKKLLREARISGAPVEEAELRDALARSGFPLLPGRPFGTADQARIERAVDAILGSGFTVETDLADVSETDVVLDVRIEKGERPRIASIAFTGNEELDDGELLDVMRLRPSGLLARLSGRDRFDPATLEADRERVRTLYRRRGFAFADVGPAEVEPGPEGVAILLPVREGERYRFASFEVEPGSLLSEEQLRAWLPEPGAPFDGRALEDVVERIERHYRSRGYPMARVELRESVAPDGTGVVTTLEVEEGSFARVGRIRFSGHYRHRDPDLRALLDLVETERFDTRKLEGGVAALMSLGHFASVQPDVDLSPGTNRADIVYRLDEIDTFEYLVGGGLNGTQGGSGNGQFVTRSLFGRSETLRLDVDLGNRFQSFVASYRDPSILRSLGPLGARLMLAADVRRSSVTFPDDTSEDTFDVALGAGGPMGSTTQLAGLQRFVAFTLDSTLTGDVPFLTPFLGRRFRTSRTSLALTEDGRDRPVFPSRGRLLEAGYELVTLDVRAHRARASLAQLLSLDRANRHGLDLSARVEAVWSFGETRAAGLPRFERLFLGSENDMRGFEIRSVGPSSDGVVVGGDRLLHASAEYRFTVIDRFRLVGFFDVGNVWASDFEGEPRPGLRYDAGAEARILVPVASLPLRIGYGWNLDRLGDEPPGRFFVTLALRF